MKPSYKDYLRVIEKFKRTTILHVGDLVLDQFLFGEISRISREAPVLILKYGETINIPGGGANAINNLLTLGARVLPIGLLGNDEAGDWLYHHFRNMGVDISGIFRNADYTTPVKTRILAGSFHSSMQQMLRIDRENPAGIPWLDPEEILSKIGEFLPLVDGVVVSDYGYGIVTDEIVQAIKRRAARPDFPVIVDSRFAMNRFHNVTSITPNISEVEEAYQTRIGEDLNRMDAIANRIIQDLGLEALLITRGRLGMSLYRTGDKPVHISVYGSDEVADVTGAGDTVISVYSLALACGANFETAARMSNYAGGLVVMKRGTATVSDKELVSAIRSDFHRKKIALE
jgi:rfaE bifunctional protein kinase chain/domain